MLVDPIYSNFDVQNERKIKKLENYLNSLHTEFEDYKEGHFIPKDEEEFAALVENIFEQVKVEHKKKRLIICETSLKVQ